MNFQECHQKNNYTPFLCYLASFLPKQTYFMKSEEIDIIPQKLKLNTDSEIFYIPTKSQFYISYAVATLPHELAHLVEIKKERVLQVDFGFLPLSQSMNLSDNSDSYFFAALIRETRVRAIEAKLNKRPLEEIYKKWINHTYWGFHDQNLQSFGLKKSMEYLDLPIGTKHLPFGRFQTPTQVRDYLWELMKKTDQNYSEAKIETLMIERTNIIKNWMATS